MRKTLYPVAAVLIAAAATLVVACGGSNASQTSAAPLAASPSSATESLQSRYVATVKSVSPSIVEVETPVGLGSGVVLDTKGNIVTNAHVVSTFKTFTVADSTGKRYSAKLVGTFVPNDLAVIHVTGAHLRPLAFADSSSLQVGDIVLAIGNPLGLQSSVTDGIVSALGRTVTEQNGSALPDVIQTSAAINPGNSGGALVDLDGRVVGIPTLAAIDNETSQLANGIGFAIPSDTVKTIAGQIVRNGHVVNSGRAYLGVRLSTTIAGGVRVDAVVRGGPAAKAGVVGGDTITSIKGTGVRSIDQVATVLANLKPRQRVALGVRTPAGKSRTLEVTLGQFPGS